MSYALKEIAKLVLKNKGQGSEIPDDKFEFAFSNLLRGCFEEPAFLLRSFNSVNSFSVYVIRLTTERDMYFIGNGL